MGKLINPRLGDYLDRYTILLLKCEYATTHDATEIFKEEATTIYDLISDKPDWRDPALALAVTNGQIWEATNIQAEFIERRYSDDAAGRATNIQAEFIERRYGDDASRVNQSYIARRLYHLNRVRADQIHKLNELDAGGPLPKEKIDD